MQGKDAKAATAARDAMAKASGTDLAGFDAQLATTQMFCDAGGGGRVHQEPEAGRRPWTSCATSSSTTACSAKAASVDVVGIGFPGGKTLGDADNVKLRFDPTLHEAGGRRQALSRAPAVTPPDQPATRPRGGAVLARGALPFVAA